MMDKKVSLRELVADKIVFALLIAIYYWMWARNDWRSFYPSLQYAVYGFTFYYFIAAASGCGSTGRRSRRDGRDQPPPLRRPLPEGRCRPPSWCWASSAPSGGCS